MSTKAKIEAVIYAADEPVTLAQLAAIFGEELLAGQDEPELPLASVEAPAAEASASVPDAETAPAPAVAADPQPELAVEDPEARRKARLRERAAREAVQKLVQELSAEYASSGRGVEIREIAGGYRIATKPEYHDAVRAFIRGQKPPMKLSLQALETLAVVAYKQPITAAEVGAIRGTECGPVLKGLLEKKLIRIAGRKNVVGRPLLYATTKEFLIHFGLNSLEDLPSFRELEEVFREGVRQESLFREVAPPAGDQAKPFPRVVEPPDVLQEAVPAEQEAEEPPVEKEPAHD
jgi:segregation and condensation protein B